MKYLIYLKILQKKIFHSKLNYHFYFLHLLTKPNIKLCKLYSFFFSKFQSYSRAIINLQGGGPSWPIPLGRKDSLTANRTLANQNLPAPFFTLDQLKASFAVQGLDTFDLVALSGI